jgi:molybdopterin converting factor small subunit
MQITVRYYAAAQAAAGVAEEPLTVPDGATLADVLEAALAVDRVPAAAGARSSAGPTGAASAGRAGGAPALAEVLRRCSFLVNEVAAKDRSRVLADGDVLDVLPPFAGG